MGRSSSCRIGKRER